MPIFAAMVPALAFLQKQVYPDGLLISLTLLFFVALARRHWKTCIGIGILLVLTKLVFIVVLPVALVAYLLQRGALRAKLLVRGGLVVLAPVALILFNYVFFDLGYRVVLERPYARGYSLDRAFSGADLRVRCGGHDYTIARKDIFWVPITTPWTVAPDGPLSQDQARQFGCTEGDLRAMKRRLIATEFLAAPLLHLRLGARAFLRSLVGAYDVGHVSHILSMRRQLWREHFDERSYFTDYEVKLLPEYRKIGFEIAQNQPLIFTLNMLTREGGEWVIRFAAIGLIALYAAIAFRRRTLRALLQDPVNIGLILFLATYSACVVVSIPVVYDRYAYVNLVVLCLFASRWASMAQGRDMSALRE